MTATFDEASATQRIESLPLAHLSLELGHLYIEDFEQGPDRLAELFHQVAPWARVAADVCRAAVAPQHPRISTCFLIDDYFNAFSSPREVLPMLLGAAKEAGLRIDYIAREAACATADDIPLAHLVASRLVADPPTGTTGARPPVQETGWLSNGVRSPQQPFDEAMRPELAWRPPIENGANRHSIFVDVELWDEHGGARQWSCPFLASVWQLLRLGALRASGDSVIRPRRWTGEFPDTWPGLPPVIELGDDTAGVRIAPFAAYRTFSVLAGRFLPIEQAVRTIVSQVAVDPAVTREVLRRAESERLTVSAEVVDRIEYAFTGPPWRGGDYGDKRSAKGDAAAQRSS